MRRLTLILLLLPLPLVAEDWAIGLLGHFPEARSAESLAAHVAVDAAKADAASRITLHVFDTQGNTAGAVEAAAKLVQDSQVLGVVVHGEEGASPECLRLFEDAGLAVVMASSWSSPRSLSNTATWLCPTQSQLAGIAAIYARKGKKAQQVAVVDNGAPTASAAANVFARRFKEMGGRVDLNLEWRGEEATLDQTIRNLKAHWPQVVFFAGEGREAGKLVKAMRDEKELHAAALIGLPPLFDPAFIDEGRMDTKLATGVFPSPEYKGAAQLARATGVAFKKDTPNQKAYARYAYNQPGRWTAMVFDATQLMMAALEKAGTPTRAAVKTSLDSIPSYKGIRGLVKFNAKREPSEARAMILYLLPRVNSREMRWYEKQFGPPFQ